MTVLYRGLVSGQYVYWNSNQVTPSGVSDTIILNDNVTPRLLTRPPLDSNHTHVWYLGEGCTTDGINIIPEVGGITMTKFSGTGSLTTGYGIFNTQKSALLSGSTQGLNGFNGNIDISTTSSVTFECIARIPSWGTDTGVIGQYQPFVQLTSDSPYDQINFNYVWASNQFHFTTAIAANYNTQAINYGAGNWGTVVPEIPHHFMTTWDYSTKVVKYYIDGYNFATYTWGSNRGRAFKYVQIYMAPNGFSVADVRISDVVRSQGYALAATNAMRSL